MGVNDFILQERIKGVEVNTEIFFSKGEPILAQANLECKKRHNGDMGYATGCTMDTCWIVPLDCPLIQKTCGLFIPKMKELGYTGFMDSNVIIEDEDKIWFLEFCGRTGYNAHVTFFATIGKKTYLQSVADLIDGEIVEGKKGFGASITLFTDREKIGIPIHVHKPVIPFFHLFDGYKDGTEEHPGDYQMGGYGAEIAIVSGHGYTIPTAFQEAMHNACQVKFVNKDNRTDADKTDFPTSPIRRYEALEAMGMI